MVYGTGTGTYAANSSFGSGANANPLNPYAPQQGANNPQYGRVPYVNNDPASLGPDPHLQGGQNPEDILKIISQLSGLMGNSGSSGPNYQYYTPQELAQRGLGQAGIQGQALNAQGSFLGLQGQTAGLMHAQSMQDMLRKAMQDRHTAQGGFAASGAINSDAARQTLGNQGNMDYFNAMGGQNPTQPWMNNGRGDIANALTSAQNSENLNYNLKQNDLYTQLMQLLPSLNTNSNQTDLYNRVLNNQYTNQSPEQSAQDSAMRSARYGLG